MSAESRRRVERFSIRAEGHGIRIAGVLAQGLLRPRGQIPQLNRVTSVSGRHQLFVGSERHRPRRLLQAPQRIDFVSRLQIPEPDRVLRCPGSPSGVC